MRKPSRPLKTYLEIILAMVLLIASILPAFSCGSATEDVDTIGIDFSGGVVEDADQKAKVEVPIGAIAEGTEIGVTPTEAPVLIHGMSTLGDAYEFGPAGTTFNKAVTVTLKYEESGLPEGVTPADLLLCIVTEDGGFTPLSNIRVDTEASTISGDTTHFSVIAITYVEGESDLEVFPSRYYFGDALITTTGIGTITVANPTSNNILITSLQVVSLGGEWIDPLASLFPAFSVDNQNRLPINVAAGDKQEINVGFSPTEAGPYRADLLVSTVDTTIRIPLQGEGVLNIGLLEIAPDSHDYGTVRLEPAPADTKKAIFSVTNDTNLDIQINAVQVSTFPFSTGSFTLEGLSPAGTILRSQGGIAPLQATYTPQTENLEFGYILLQGTASNGDAAGVVCILQGRGISGVDVKIDPLDFDRVLVGETKTLNTTITNTGSADFNQTGYATSDWDFWPYFPPAWVAPLAVGQSATGAINFTPQKKGIYTAFVRAAARIGTGWIYHDAPIKGIGIEADISFNPSPCVFRGVCVGATAEMPLKITNVGDFDWKIDTLAYPTKIFNVVNAPSVGSTLAIGQSHTCTVQFAPTEEGVFTDEFEITIEYRYDGKTYKDTWYSFFYGIALPDQKVGISIKPDIDFGDVLVGTTEEMTTTVWNDSDSYKQLFMGISKPAVSAAYFVEGGYGIFNPSTLFPVNPVGGFALQPSPFRDSAEVVVTFTPSERDYYTGIIRASGKVSGKDVQAMADVVGRGVAPELRFDPNQCDFGEVPVGGSKDIWVTVMNTGDFDLTIKLYEWPGAPFEGFVATPEPILAKYEDDIFSFEFTPPQAGTFMDTFEIVVEYEYRGETKTEIFALPLMGEGVEGGPELAFDPNPCDFGEVCVGESRDIGVKVTNTGDFDFTIKGYMWPGAPFERFVATQDLTLARDEYKTFNFTFTPPQAGTYLDTFKIIVEYEYMGETKTEIFSLPLRGTGIECIKPWDVYISALNLFFTTFCPITPIYNFTGMLTVFGDDPEPMPGATITVGIYGPGINSTRTLTTNSQGQASTTFQARANGTFTIEIIDIIGEYAGRPMQYNSDKNQVTEVSKSAP
ncbi:choice-of-anchor D domain-containing protein [Chloroflexota bacterium]